MYNKKIQVIIFVLLVFAFTFNHYKLSRPCVEYEKKNTTNPILGITSDISVCKQYRLLPNGLVSKGRHTQRIPADFIFLFIGAGIIYFTKGIRK